MYPEIEQFEQFLSGKLYIQKKSGGPLSCIGDWEKPSLAVETEKYTIPNFITPGGGDSKVLERVKTVSLNFTMYNLKPENMAIFAAGESGTMGVSSVTGGEYTGYTNSLIRLPGLVDQVTAVTSTDGSTTYTDGTDYHVVDAGVTIPKSGAIATADTGDGVDLLIDFSTLDIPKVEFLVNKGEEYFFSFIAQNEERDNLTEIFDFFRVKPKITEEIQLISEDGYNRWNVSCEVLADSSITGAGLSQHMRYMKKEV